MGQLILPTALAKYEVTFRKNKDEVVHGKFNTDLSTTICKAHENEENILYPSSTHMSLPPDSSDHLDLGCKSYWLYDLAILQSQRIRCSLRYLNQLILFHANISHINLPIDLLCFVPKVTRTLCFDISL